MARHEEDREDLMREAVALPDRVELCVAGFEVPISIGFRTTSAMSIFVGQDPVYQYDPDGRLRRAFVGGLLYRSQHSTLAMLQRKRTETQTLLLRTDLGDAELSQFRENMNVLVSVLHQRLTFAEFETLRRVPEATDHISRILAALQAIQNADPWLSPAIRRRN
jgi:hypothetical protein